MLNIKTTFGLLNIQMYIDPILNPMKTIILVIAVLFVSCKEQQNSVIGKTTKISSELNKEFKSTDHLFLNYYFGMTVEDYEIATRVNFQQKKILLADDRSDCKLSAFSESHKPEDIESISRLSQIYYVFGDGKDAFEAVIKPLFKNNRLARIELRTLNCFNVGNHNHEFYRRKVNEIHETLLKFHKEKHGNYTVSRRAQSEQEIAAYKDAGISMEFFDANKYIFDDNGKIISVEQKCCDFKPIVIYAVDDSRLEEILYKAA